MQGQASECAGFSRKKRTLGTNRRGFSADCANFTPRSINSTGIPWPAQVADADTGARDVQLFAEFDNLAF
jgi:hypothetical protein